MPGYKELRAGGKCSVEYDSASVQGKREYQWSVLLLLFIGV